MLKTEPLASTSEMSGLTSLSYEDMLKLRLLARPSSMGVNHWIVWPVQALLACPSEMKQQDWLVHV